MLLLIWSDSALDCIVPVQVVSFSHCVQGHFVKVIQPPLVFFFFFEMGLPEPCIEDMHTAFLYFNYLINIGKKYYNNLTN
jgi:hypothetical protein